MNKTLIKVSTSNMSRDQWLDERRKFIGGSDAAVIVGMNSYVTPYMLWADKTGRLPKTEDNEAMRQGRDFEEYVASRFVEFTGKKVQRVNYILQNPIYPFACANIDRKVVGEKAGLECKTTSVLSLKKFKNGEYPENYYAQCVHYMAVTGFEKWYLAVLIMQRDFKVFEIERDEQEIAALMNAEEQFYNTYIKLDQVPLADGLKATTDTINTIYSESVPKNIIIYERDIIKNYLQIKKRISELEKEKEKYEQVLKQKIGNFESGTCGDYVINWSNKTRKTFDYKKFAENNPSIDISNYFKQSRHRIFSIKKAGDNI